MTAVKSMYRAYHVGMFNAHICWLIALMFLAMPVVAQQPGGAGQDRAGAARKPSLALTAAIETGNWLTAVSRQTEHGLTWPVVPADGPADDHSLYSGTPGVILFMIELHRATGDKRWIDAARAGGDELIAWMDANGEANNAGLWTGLGGQMFVLHQLHKATHEPRYLEAAKNAAQGIMTAARSLDESDPSTAFWNDSTDIVSGTAGIGLAMLYADEHLEIDDALTVARKAGETLLRQAVVVDLGEDQPGLKWPMTPDFPRTMPNFSHGTAGNAYFLTKLHQAGTVRNRRFLDAAQRGAMYLLSIADTTDGQCLVFHHEPAGEDLFYLSWCHGPVGTSRLFQALGEITGGAQWSQWVEAGVKGIVGQGIPHRRTAGFWNNYGQCCGSAGVGGFALDLLQRDELPESEARRYRRLAQVLAADVLAHGQRVTIDQTRAGLKWTHAEHRVRPEFVQAQTGYAQGAAGIGLFLLDVHFDETSQPLSTRFPDEPAW